MPEPNVVKPKSVPKCNQIKRRYGNYDDFVTEFNDSFVKTLEVLSHENDNLEKRNTFYFKNAISEAIRYNVPPNVACAIMNGKQRPISILTKIC